MFSKLVRRKVQIHEFLLELLIYFFNVSLVDICIYQQLSEKFIEKHKNRLYPSLVGRYQRLSESFIERNREWVCWDMVSKYQKLSVAFLRRNMHMLNFSIIAKRRDLMSTPKLNLEFRSIIEFSIKSEYRFKSEYYYPCVHYSHFSKIREKNLMRQKSICDECLLEYLRRQNMREYIHFKISKMKGDSEYIGLMVKYLDMGFRVNKELKSLQKYSPNIYFKIKKNK